MIGDYLWKICNSLGEVVKTMTIPASLVTSVRGPSDKYPAGSIIVESTESSPYFTCLGLDQVARISTEAEDNACKILCGAKEANSYGELCEALNMFGMLRGGIDLAYPEADTPITAG